MTNFEKVGLFMKTFGQEVKTKASFPPDKIKKLRIQHYDLYRLKNKKECLNIGLFEDDDVISIIEWPEKVHFKPKKRIEIYFKYFDNYNSRLLKIKFFGKNEA